MNQPVDDDEGGLAILSSLLEDSSPQVLAVITNMITSRNTPPQEIETAPIPDKSKRTKIHGIVKKYFGSFLTTSTSQENGILFRGSSDKEQRRSQNARPDWKSLGDYLEFTLYKENKDTMEAIDLLCKRLR